VEAAVSLLSREKPLSRGLLAVERQLAALWHVDQGESPRVRACFYNLIAITDGEPPPEAAETIDAVGATHPARNIMIQIDPRTGELGALDWDVNAVCRREPSGDVVCCERVDLRLGAEPENRVVSLLEALLMPDLPTVAWLISGPPANLPPRALYPIVDRWLVDSRRFPFAAAAELAANAPGYLADLGWIASSTWRELLARAFDDVAVRPVLQTIDQIDLAYSASRGAKGGPVPVELRLIGGWLGERLGLEWQNGQFAAPGRVVRVRLSREEQKNGSNGPRLERLAVHGTLDSERTTVTIERDPEHQVFHWWRATQRFGGVRRSQLVGKQDDAWLVATALDASEPDHVLRAGLRAADRFQPPPPDGG
jgi:glucose-6-phosphate dehydrogenase assembly protein OpcA